MIQITAVAPERLDFVWEDIKYDIQAALEYANGELLDTHVYEMIEQQEVLPLIVYEDGEQVGVITLEIVEKPLKRIINIMTTGGNDIDNWLVEALTTIKQLAVEQHADAIYIHGRRGWEKKLKQYGYEHAYTVLKLEL